MYDVKHDGRHKTELVDDGQLTDIPVEIFYFRVISFRGIRLLAFLSDLNKMETWATNIGSAYLEAKTLYQVCIIAGT